jgi:hypothetical protein
LVQRVGSVLQAGWALAASVRSRLPRATTSLGAVSAPWARLWTTVRVRLLARTLAQPCCQQARALAPQVQTAPPLVSSRC